MPITAPTPDQLRAVATRMGLTLSEDDLMLYAGLVQTSVDSYNVVDSLPDELPPVKYPREAGRRASAEENPYNAWYWKARVEGSGTGKLAGRTVVLKDNVMLAGVPMMNGSATLEGYVPDVDATVVTRILDAGGVILGKAHCEGFCLSGGSHTNATGPVHNPHRMGRSSGGSSSGSAVLVARGEADMAIGGDQGGSIRMPASFCGIYGMKPTHGLVPYTGVMPIEVFIDHVGPMTATVADNALLLEVIAGADGYDPRQYAPRVHRYTESLEGGVRGLRIALVKEGFGLPTSEPDVDAKVRAAAARLAELGAVVSEVSIPWHYMAAALWIPIGVEGLTQTMMWGDGYGLGRPDLYVTSLMDFHRGWRRRADDLPEAAKVYTLFGTYVHDHWGSRYYGKAMNVTRRLTAAYDAALAEHDLLLLPTTPMKAPPLPGPEASHAEKLLRTIEPTTNTLPFDLTHHPAMSVPCGTSDGLPVGMMLVGRHWDEPTIYRAAHAFEQAGDWRTM